MRTSSISRLVHPGRAALISVVLFGIFVSGSSLMESLLSGVKAHEVSRTASRAILPRSRCTL